MLSANARRSSLLEEEAQLLALEREFIEREEAVRGEALWRHRGGLE